MNPLVSEFLSLECCEDILNVLNPINNIEKELTESMSVVKEIKSLVMDKSKTFGIIELCAGNSLTSIISLFLYPQVKKVISLDIRMRDRDWDKIDNFNYVFADIYMNSLIHNGLIDELEREVDEVMMVSIHSCGRLSEQVIRHFNTGNANYLFLNPCCEKGVDPKRMPQVVLDKLGKYLSWAFYLFNKIYSDEKKLKQLNKSLSPKNLLIMAKK